MAETPSPERRDGGSRATQSPTSRDFEETPIRGNFKAVVLPGGSGSPSPAGQQPEDNVLIHLNLSHSQADSLSSALSSAQSSSGNRVGKASESTGGEESMQSRAGLPSGLSMNPFSQPGPSIKSVNSNPFLQPSSQDDSKNPFLLKNAPTEDGDSNTNSPKQLSSILSELPLRSTVERRFKCKSPVRYMGPAARANLLGGPRRPRYEYVSTATTPATNVPPPSPTKATFDKSVSTIAERRNKDLGGGIDTSKAQGYKNPFQPKRVVTHNPLTSPFQPQPVLTIDNFIPSPFVFQTAQSGDKGDSSSEYSSKKEEEGVASPPRAVKPLFLRKNEGPKPQQSQTATAAAGRGNGNRKRKAPVSKNYVIHSQDNSSPEPLLRRPEWPKPELPEPELTKPELPKRELTKPELPKRELPKAERVKSQWPRAMERLPQGPVQQGLVQQSPVKQGPGPAACPLSVFSPNTPFFSTKDMPASKTTYKTMISDNGWLERTTDPVEKKSSPEKKVGFLGILKKKAKEVTDLTAPRIARDSEKELAIARSRLKLSLNPQEQAIVYSNLEFALADALNAYITAEFNAGNLDTDKLKKVSDRWTQKGRPGVVGFRYDVETQLELVRLHASKFRFYGRNTAVSHVVGNIDIMMANARAMRVRTFCQPDSVIAKQLADTQILFGIIGCEHPEQMRLADVVTFFKNIADRESFYDAKMEARTSVGSDPSQSSQNQHGGGGGARNERKPESWHRDSFGYGPVGKPNNS